jgi:hypothetical protein
MPTRTVFPNQFNGNLNFADAAYMAAMLKSTVANTGPPLADILKNTSNGRSISPIDATTIGQNYVVVASTGDPLYSQSSARPNLAAPSA